MNQRVENEQETPQSVGGQSAVWVQKRAAALFESRMLESRAQTDRMFAWLMLGQWIFGIGIAAWLSPRVWAGSTSATHIHLYAAIGLGAAISLFPWFAAWKLPGALVTRVSIGVAQMLWAGLLVHLMGGRIETHFHIFGSLAFLAFYRDLRVLIPATVVTAADHFIRGALWPESIYGLANPEWWRFLEHAGWVVFIDVFLIMQSLRGLAEMRDISLRQAETEYLRDEEKSARAALGQAMRALEDAQESMVRTEKLAAVGQLAAGVGHELRNPLAAIRNAHTFIGKKLDKGGSATELKADERIIQFRGIIDRELNVCAKIISDLLDFARSRAPVTNPVPLRGLIDECLALVPKLEHVTLINDVPDDLAHPEVDKDQIRQVFVNLIQNASEAMPDVKEGRVVVSASAGPEGDFSVRVTDNGAGIPEEQLKKIFQPLFSTKTKGTGLGLAIVSQLVERHGGSIVVESEVGRGTTFTVKILARPSATIGAAEPQERVEA
jgi:two-component system sensor histidine kinase HydH